MGQCHIWKDYTDKFLETILRRYPSTSMIIAVNDYYGNDVINRKRREQPKHSAADVGGRTKNVYPAKERHFPGRKEFNSFFFNSTISVCRLS